LTATTRVSSLIDLHEADGTLTLNNITLDGLTTSKATSGLIYRCKGPLVAQNISIANITAPLANYSSAFVSILEDQGTFTDITVDNYTLTNVITFFTNLSGLVSNYTSNSPLSFTNVAVNGITINGNSNSKVGSLLGAVEVFYTPNLTVNSCSVINGFIRGKNTGGLLGSLYINNLQMDNSSYEGSLPDGGNSTLGGLIGSMSGTSATINSSYVKSDVTVWTGVGGGLIGTTSATTVNINNSFYRGNVTSTDSSSGVVGGIFASMSAGTLTLTNVYAAGSVSGNFKKGCIGGYKPSGTLVANDVYYDSTLCTTNAVDSGAFSGITGSNTATMQPSSPFTNWSSGTWLFSLGFYPELQ
ncbi:MAG: hypothetical protein KDD50_07345, partial [Bdellovibrionales bacterium]|nr:hypothetical protein [Bdellovibrionales bacterium]